jgi:dsRNA-specific ribonuclease
MGYSQFEDDKKDEFINQAQEMGIGPAMRYLGYPKSYHTAKKWFNEKNIDLPSLDTLAQMSAKIGAFYSDKEKILAAQTVLDRCVESLMQDNLDADQLNKLSNAVHKAIQTINLIEGKSTAISENRSKDGTDLAIHDLLNEAKMRNELVKHNMIESSTIINENDSQQEYNNNITM